MAKTSKCDNCGSPAVGDVTVDLLATGVVEPGLPTGIRHAVYDCCEKSACRKKLWSKIFQAAIGVIEDAIPRHKTMIRTRNEMAMIDRDLATLAPDHTDRLKLARKYDALQIEHDTAAKG